MTWRDQLQPASFKRAGFKVDSHDSQYGRRTVTHEYPQRDKPFVEDLGRAARKIRIDGYIVGKNYQRELEALIAACESGGPGTLIHPYRGTMTVSCESLSVRESKDDGGMATVSLSFVEYGDTQFPSATKDNRSRFGIAADSVVGRAITDFSETFTIGGMPQFVLDSASSYVTDLSEFLQGTGSSILPIDNWTEFYRDCRSLATDVADLIQYPDQLATRVTGLFGYLTSYGATGKSSVFSLIEFFNFGDDRPAIPATTSTRRRQRANESALNALVKQTAVAESGRLASLTEFATFDDAVTAQTLIADEIDVQSEVSSDQQYIALIGLRSELVTSVPSSADLPRVTTISTRSVTPSLVLAHRLYADANRADEIVAQNRIRHPGFISPATQLQVLSSE